VKLTSGIDYIHRHDEKNGIVFWSVFLAQILSICINACELNLSGFKYGGKYFETRNSHGIHFHCD